MGLVENGRKPSIVGWAAEIALLIQELPVLFTQSNAGFECEFY